MSRRAALLRNRRVIDLALIGRKAHHLQHRKAPVLHVRLVGVVEHALVVRVLLYEAFGGPVPVPSLRLDGAKVRRVERDALLNFTLAVDLVVGVRVFKVKARALLRTVAHRPISIVYYLFMTLGLDLTGDAGGETTLMSLSSIGELVRDAPLCRFALSV